MTKGPEFLTIDDREVRPVGYNDVLVHVHGSGVNRADILQRRGSYPAPFGEPHDVMGLEYAGVIEKVGKGVDTRKIDDRVMGIVGGGGYSEHVVVPANATVPIPQQIATLEAAAIPEAFFTAYDAIFTRGDLAAGERLLIHAVASGVGTAALQLAQWAGAEVIGTSRTAAKLEQAKKLGLGRGVVTNAGWDEDVYDVDVVLDLVGGRMLESSAKVLRDRGRHVLVGLTAGSIAEIDLGAFLRKRLTLVGTVLRSRPEGEKHQLARANTQRVVPAFEAGKLAPVVDETIKPGAILAAHK
ncbi:MAG: zinc-binding dehydrogenase, partial [Clostridia bacterium]|nr:zinc-binding dehydrogenase [Deltaproteobacteria bacterium]